MFVFVCLFVPHVVNQHIDNIFSLWAASIDKHIASLAARPRHCAFFLVLSVRQPAGRDLDTLISEMSLCCRRVSARSPGQPGRSRLLITPVAAR